MVAIKLCSAWHSSAQLFPQSFIFLVVVAPLTKLKAKFYSPVWKYKNLALREDEFGAQFSCWNVVQKWQNKEWALASIPVESDRRHCWGPEECFRFSGEEGMMKHPTDFKQVWI